MRTIESATAEPAPAAEPISVTADVDEPGEAGIAAEEPPVLDPDSLESAEAKADEAWLEGATQDLHDAHQSATAASVDAAVAAAAEVIRLAKPASTDGKTPVERAKGLRETLPRYHPTQVIPLERRDTRVTPYAERFLSELIIDEYDGGHHNPYTAYNYSPTGAVYGPLYTKMLGQVKHHGRFDSKGAHVKFKTGHVYDGDFNCGMMHGQGKLSWPDGTTYTGEFRDNTISGQGEYRWPDGSSYQGQVDHGLRHGQGVYMAGDEVSTVYEGTWHRGKRHGKGSLQYSSKAIYVGEFEHNYRSGQGKMNYESGNWYAGEWKADLRHGAGTMMWKTVNERYVGQWVEGIQDGHGEHVWEQQRFSGTQYPRQNRFVGHFTAGQRDGYGEFFYASGAEYRGGWWKDLKHGASTFVDVDGFVTKNTYADDVCVPTEEVAFVPAGKDVYEKSAETPFHFDLTDLPGGSDPAQLKEIFVVLLRHITVLQAVYKKYSTLGLGSNRHNTCTLDRLRFHRFLKDINFEMHGATLCDVDRAILHCCHDEKTGWSLHGPSDTMLPRHFYEALIRCAYLAFGAKYVRSKFVIADCLSNLVNSRSLAITYVEVLGNLFNLPTQVGVLDSIPKFQALYDEYATEFTPGDKTMNGRTLLRLCRDKGVFENTPCDSSIVLKLIQECNTAMLSTKCVDTRVELALLDMIEVLLGCALFTKPAVPETKLIQSLSCVEEGHAEADASPETAKGGDDDNEPPKLDFQSAAIFAVTVAEHEEIQGNIGAFRARELHNRLETLFQLIL